MLEPKGRLAGRQAGGVNFQTVAHHAWNDAESRGHAGRSGSYGRTQGRVEHRRIKFAWRTIGIDKGTRETRGDQRCAEFGHTFEQLVDKCILGAPQADGVEPRKPGEALRVEPA